MKIRPMGADRQTDRHGQAVAFRNFANAPEKHDLLQTDDDQPAVCHSNPER